MKNEFHWKKGLLMLLIPLTFIGASAWIGPEDVCEEEMAVTKLWEICGSSTAVQGAPPAEHCPPGSLYYLLTDSCTSYVPMTIYLSNISTVPEYDVIYDLPAGVDDLYLQHEAAPGILLTSGPYNQNIVYKGNYDDNGEIMHLFGIDVFLETYETNYIGCEPDVNDARTFPMYVRLMDENSQTYPVEDQADEYTGVFSCRVFHETHCRCIKPECIADEPIYDITVCFECQCGKSDEKNEKLDQTTTFTNTIDQVQVSPNPFQNQFKVNFELNRSSTVTYRIVDIQGKVIIEEQEEIEIGDQEKTFDMNNYSEGVYYLQILSEKIQINKRLVLMGS